MVSGAPIGSAKFSPDMRRLWRNDGIEWLADAAIGLVQPQADRRAEAQRQRRAGRRIQFADALKAQLLERRHHLGRQTQCRDRQKLQRFGDLSPLQHESRIGNAMRQRISRAVGGRDGNARTAADGRQLAHHLLEHVGFAAKQMRDASYVQDHPIGMMDCHQRRIMPLHPDAELFQALARRLPDRRPASPDRRPGLALWWRACRQQARRGGRLDRLRPPRAAALHGRSGRAAYQAMARSRPSPAAAGRWTSLAGIAIRPSSSQAFDLKIRAFPGTRPDQLHQPSRPSHPWHRQW